MSGKASSARYSPNRTDSMIGAGSRIDGNIDFTGVLRVQGDIVGDISCDVDANGAIVVDSSGNATGTIKAPNLVVRGRVSGPVLSSQSVQVQQGASVVGDVSYKEIEIHAGGVVEGLLTPTVSMDSEASGPARRVRAAQSPAVRDRAMASANDGGFMQRIGGRRTLGGAALLAIVAMAAVWVAREPSVVTATIADVALKADSSMKDPPMAPSPSPPPGGGLQHDPAPVAGNAAPLAPAPDADSKTAAQASPPDQWKTDTEKLVTVRGVNPSKPAGFFWLVSKEPAVLFKKKRHDPGDGTRIDVSQGAKVSIAIAEDEIFRVVQGRGVEILYQGRKVGPKTMESGAWMNFVPESPGEAGARK